MPLVTTFFLHGRAQAAAFADDVGRAHVIFMATRREGAFRD